MPPSPHATSTHAPPNLALSRQALLEWFDLAREKRRMPWRRLAGDLGEGESRKAYRARLGEVGRGQWAYEVMIAEVMLQQTQVATVIPYFQRWLLKYPTIDALALGTQDEVHALWSGLGYYSRATRLLSAAQKVASSPSRLLPSTAAALEKDVPGVGPYTAGAIASIVQGHNVPLVDGNVQRVLARLLGVYADPKAKAVNVFVWERARELVEAVEEGRGGDWNEGLMELGATICKPTDAKCGECPLSASCVAFQESSSSAPQPEADIEDLCTLCLPIPPAERAKGVCAYPMKAAKKAPRDEDVQVTVVEWRPHGREADEGLFLVVKRPEKGLLAGLYEFPSLPLPSPPSDAALLAHVSSLLPPSTPLPPTTTLRAHGSVFHQFSHISATYHVAHLVVCSPSAGRPPDVDRGRWVDRGMLEGTADGANVDVNMGTGGKKCWALVWSDGGPPKKKAAGSKKRASATTKAPAGKKAPAAPKLEKGQAKLSVFFDGKAAGELKRKAPAQDVESVVDDEAASRPRPPPAPEPAAKPARVKSAVVKRRQTVLISDDEDDGDVEVLS